MKKLIVYFMGGLGNQLFQYATGYKIAKKNNLKLILDNSHYIEKVNRNRWRYYVIIPKLINNINLRKAIKLNKISSINKIILIVQYGITNYYKEKIPFRYDTKLTNIKSNTFIKGYFQSYKYFDSCRDEIIEIFTKNMTLNSKSKKTLDKINNSNNTVAIHFRDYSHIKTGGVDVEELMGSCNYDYYKNAIKILEEKKGKLSFFIFSNNIEKAKEIFSFLKEKILIDNDLEIIEPWEDMYLMSKCDNNIIANSSYSWWSAYLNKNKSKTVIAPKKWVKSFKDENSNDLIPPEWIRI